MFFVGISFLHCCGKLEFRVTFTLNRILSRIKDFDMIDYLETQNISKRISWVFFLLLYEFRSTYRFMKIKNTPEILLKLF